MSHRICNFNSFSALIDRLIIENLKLINFIEVKNLKKIKSQEAIIDGLRNELSEIMVDVANGKYRSLSENRTYLPVQNTLLDDIFKLCICNHVIGKIDRKKIKAASGRVRPAKLRNYILQVRDYLEFRAHIKNRLEDTLS